MWVAGGLGPVQAQFSCRLYQAWDEFKPYKKENKRTRARERARASVDSPPAGDAADEGCE
jgi:hypothetical protein